MGLFDLQRVEVKSRADWRNWLQANHRQAESIWLVSYKRSSPHYLAYAEIVEEALCFGWIDSRPAKLDERRSMLLLSPRKPGSNWSKLNKDRVAALSAAGLIAPAGQAKIDQARRDGTWDALNSVDALEMPADLTAALRQHPPAETNFAAFPPSTRRGILDWLLSAKTESTRAQRLSEIAILAAQNIRANTPAARAYRSRTASTK
jgi:uncharacterized protein YdeI (YjbR/CyaY-like superfamily)